MERNCRPFPSGNQTDGEGGRWTERERSGRERCDFERKWEGVKTYKDVQKGEEVERGEMKGEMEQTNRE